MAGFIQSLVHGLLRAFMRTVWSVVSLILAGGLGYFIGQRWGLAQGDPRGPWFGLLGGFAVWAIFLRPRSRRLMRRLSGRSDPHDDYLDDGGWFDGDGGDD